VSTSRLAVGGTVTPTPKITTQPAGTAICSDGTVKLTVAASNATAYQWRKNGSDVSEGSNYTTAAYTTAALAANATYSVVVYNNACSTVSDNAVVTVYSDFTPGAILTTGETICYGATPGAIGNSTAATGGNGVITYEWRRNNTVISGATASSYTPAASYSQTDGAQTFTRWAKDGACSTTLVQSTGQWVLTVRPAFTPGAILTTGETICYGATPGVIGNNTAAVGGNSVITYEWRRNNTVISGATASSYTPAASYSQTDGAQTFTRWAKDGACSTTLVQSTGQWILTVRPAFTPGAILTTGETICHGATPGAIGNNTAAAGGNGVITYEWRRNNTAIPGATASAYTPAASYSQTDGAQTFTRWAKDGACSTTSVQSTGQWILTVRPAFTAGTITTASKSTPEGTDPNVTIANTTAASGGDGNITYQWRRSGTSSATFSYDYPTYPINNSTTNYSTNGTYRFKRYAHDGVCNTAWVESTGQYTLNVTVPTPPGAASTQTWVVGAQTWSAPLRKAQAGCTSATDFVYEYPLTVAYYRSSNLYTGSGYLYNWKCVNEQQANLCPSPWRVPAKADFVALDIALGGDGSARNNVETVAWINSTYTAKWGAVYGGVVDGSSITGGGEKASFYSHEEYSTTGGYSLTVDIKPSYTMVLPVGWLPKYMGAQVRCVR
jgi:uncharacterized protein (TIGR02145 family)